MRYLSETYPGRIHDKRLCDIEELVFPPGVTVYQPKKKRAWRCWGLCRNWHLLVLQIHAGIPAFTDRPVLGSDILGRVVLHLEL